MSVIIKSDEMSWIEISKYFYGTMNTVYAKMYSAMADAQKAIATVNGAGDIGSLEILLTMEEIEILNEKRRKIVYFANGIHYEIDELVDNPFSIAMGNIVEEAIGINPSDVSIFPEFAGVYSEYTSLTALIRFSMTDEELKKDFEARANTLDNDIMSKELQQAVKEADYWQGEYQKATECGRIADAIFTQEVRDKWSKLTVDERMQYLETYRREIACVMGEGRDVSETPMQYTTSGYGLSYPGRSHIDINPSFVNEPTGNYSLDKAIDTVTHETRHQYQNNIMLSNLKNPGKTEVPDDLISGWDIQYDSKTDYDLYYESVKEIDARAFAAIVAAS